MKTDLYAILEIPKSASGEAIKAAYRRLSKTCHPDAPGGSEEKFTLLSDAYQTLRDVDARAFYDVTGLKLDVEQDKIHAEMMKVVDVIFKSCVQDCFDKGKTLKDYGLLAHMKAGFRDSVAQASESVSQIRDQIEDLKSMVSDVIKSDGEGNIFVDRLNLLIEDREDALRQTANALRVLEAGSAEMKKYSSESEMMARSAQWAHAHSWSNATNSTSSATWTR
jgi:curved DNA-binding protein CbpA